jgi:hypothetical protein
VNDFHQKLAHRSDTHHELIERRRQQARAVIAAKLSKEKWEHLLGDARAAAQRGETEFLLLRFPCEVCTDQGRAVNAPDPSRPETLRGLPAEMFLRWKKELRPLGFALHARVTNFVDGIPGEIELCLAWD